MCHTEQILPSPPKPGRATPITPTVLDSAACRQIAEALRSSACRKADLLREVRVQTATLDRIQGPARLKEAYADLADELEAGERQSRSWATLFEKASSVSVQGGAA